jgi:hypothetical protein
MASFRILLAAVLLCLPVAVLSATPSVRVCGIELDKVSVFNWDDFKSGRGLQSLKDESRTDLYAALERELLGASVDWPEPFLSDVISRFEDLEQGLLAPVDWTLSEDERGAASMLFQMYVFNGEKRIWLPVESDEDECKDSAEMRQARAEFAVFVNLVERSNAELLKGPRKVFSKGIAVIEQEYDSYLFEGYPMFPWEAAVNSWLLTDNRIANGPPRWQLAVLHPSAGVVGQTASNTDGDIGVALLVEPIGIIRYTRDYKHWYGLSVAASFPFDREPGLGFAMTYDQFKLGVTWHNDPDGSYDGAAVVLGIELYQFVGRQHKKYDGYKKRVDGYLNRVEDILEKGEVTGSGD